MLRSSTEKIWLDALQGSAEAYRMLGSYYLRRAGRRAKTAAKKRKIRVKLAYLCLEYAAELGDAKASYLFYHNFCRGKKVIDDESYRQIANEYMETKGQQKKKELQYYLKQGTKQQQAKCRERLKAISGPGLSCRPAPADAPPGSAKKKAPDIATARQ